MIDARQILIIVQLDRHTESQQSRGLGRKRHTLVQDLFGDRVEEVDRNLIVREGLPVAERILQPGGDRREIAPSLRLRRHDSRRVGWRLPQSCALITEEEETLVQSVVTGRAEQFLRQPDWASDGSAELI